MKNTLQVLAAGLLALAGVVAQPAMAEDAASPDAQLLAQLSKTSKDLTKLHDVDFTLRFPTRTAAQAAQLKLIGLAFETNTEPGKVGNDWVIHADKVMYPAQTDLEGLRDKLNVIAAEGHGTYDGWQAKVAPAKKSGK
ncbi:MAG: ribonuclease E inhibitor RraB [Pseudomonadota bacterium]